MSKQRWTKEKIEEAIKRIISTTSGLIPVDDCGWDKFARENNGPCIYTIRHNYIELNLAQALLNLGAPHSRVSLRFTHWTNEEKEYLLVYAGIKSIRAIARHLHRSPGSVRTMLNKRYHVRARQNQGYCSAAELAKEYNCSYHRVRTLLREKVIPSHYDKERHQYQVDVVDITEDMKILLTKPKVTHKKHPTDLGNYEQRHNLTRTRINGKTVRTVRVEKSN